MRRRLRIKIWRTISNVHFTVNFARPAVFGFDTPMNNFINVIVVTFAIKHSSARWMEKALNKIVIIAHKIYIR
jgi:hypothetical protein